MGFDSDWVYKVYGRKTLSCRILETLKKEGPCSLSELSKHTDASVTNLKQKLYMLRRKTLVTDRFLRQIAPTGWPVLIHEWTLSGNGRTWLKNSQH